MWKKGGDAWYCNEQYTPLTCRASICQVREIQGKGIAQDQGHTSLPYSRTGITKLSAPQNANVLYGPLKVSVAQKNR